MLTITIAGEEFYDEEKQEFVYPEAISLDLEHSLVSVSKWEQKFKKPFLTDSEKNTEEVLAYIQYMILTPEISPEVIFALSQQNLDEIKDYMGDKATATWFSDEANPPRSTEVLTSELIYYWMFAQGIDKECENWHIHRLITLLKIFNLKNAKPKKMSRSEIAARNRELNAQRRAQLGTSG